jgi:hypothetical protein
MDAVAVAEPTQDQNSKGIPTECMCCLEPMWHPLTGCPWCGNDPDLDKCPEYAECDACLANQGVTR